jgi:hypothetical protein
MVAARSRPAVRGRSLAAPPLVSPPPAIDKSQGDWPALVLGRYSLSVTSSPQRFRSVSVYQVLTPRVLQVPLPSVCVFPRCPAVFQRGPHRCQGSSYQAQHRRKLSLLTGRVERVPAALTLEPLISVVGSKKTTLNTSTRPSLHRAVPPENLHMYALSPHLPPVLPPPGHHRSRCPAVHTYHGRRNAAPPPPSAFTPLLLPV